MLTDRSRKARPLSRLGLCSALAIATSLVVGSGSAKAQSFQGSSNVVAGSAAVATGAGTTTVTVSTPSAVIDWTPFDTAINNGVPIGFQPAGTTATFTNNPSGTSNFAVLNRIIPVDATRPIQFDGTVISRIQSTTSVPGGTVFFYSPGGIVVGSTAVFDVGNLGLTSAAPVVDGNGNWYNSNTVQFSQSASGRLIDIRPGAQITASREGSYVAAFAPSIRQNGTVTVNGQAAYVAGEAGTINFSPDGLFDIQVTVGTDGIGGGPTTGPGNAIRHGGTTTGPASSGAGDNHRIYMVAIPKNNAIFNAINGGGQVGFDIAGAANVQGNAVVLSGGYNITDGQFDATPTGANITFLQILGMQNNAPDSLAVTSTLNAKSFGIAEIITALGGTIDFASTVNVEASGRASASAGTGTLNFAGDVTLVGRRVIAQPTGAQANLFVNNGTINIGGNLTLDASNVATVLDGSSRTGGSISLNAANGGTISIGGSANLSANGVGAGSATSAAKGDGTGGNIFVGALNGGTLIIGGGLTASADGQGGNTGTLGSAGGNGTGGDVNVSANDGNSRIDIADSVSLSAQGDGGTGGIVGGVGGAGGFGNGGTAILSGVNGTGNQVNIGGSLLVSTNGDGGTGFDANGGRGDGGNSIVSASTGTTVTVGGGISVDASGFGGGTLNNGSNIAYTGGLGEGGFAQIGVIGTGGSLTTTSASVNAFGGGGSADSTGSFAITGNGGEGRGGTEAEIFLSAGTMTITGFASVGADGIGGNGVNGGRGQGGGVSVDVSGGASLSLTAGNSEDSLFISADGEGGSALVSGGRDGDGFGGTTRIVATGGGSIDIAMPVSATAEGISSSFFNDGTDGGDGTGGNANISQGTGGSIDIAGDVFLSAGGFGSANLGGGDRVAGTGRGGDARIAVNDAGGISIDGNVDVSAVGFGGSGFASTGLSSGGAGIGGLANLGAVGGALVITGSSSLEATGGGGSALLAGSGGTGTGGQVLVGTVAGVPGSITLGNSGSITLAIADGFGGDGRGTGSGGLGTGGASRVFADGGNITVNGAFDFSADAFGGSAVDGNGGAADGGDATARAGAGFTIALNGTTSPVLLSAVANGGDASGLGNGGEATQGFTILNANGGTISITGDASLNSSAFGGDGVNGGDAVALVTGQSDSVAQANNGTLRVTGQASLDASSFGGAGRDGGSGGDAVSGGASVTAISSLAGPSTVNLGAVSIRSFASGGAGGAGNAPGVAGGAGGSARSAGGVQLFGSAGNGTLTVAGDPFLLADAVGGAGGAGGDGAEGGAGGDATGGFIQFGTFSGPDTPGNTGSATMSNVLVLANGTGGAGGAGGTGANGGDGGEGFAGAFTLLSRGSPVTTGNVTSNLIGQGGNGGAGAVQGAGGNGYAGSAAVLITQRFNRTERGSLNAGNIDILASGAGGTGSTTGLGYYADSGQVTVQQSDATVSRLIFSNIGNTRPDYQTTVFVVDPVTGQQVPQVITNPVAPIDLAVTSGTLNVIGDLSIVTPGELRLTIDSGAINAANATLDAGNFVLPAAPPVVAGTLTASGSLSISTDAAFLTYANLAGAGGLNLTGTTNIRTGSLSFGGAVVLGSSGAIQTDAIQAGQLNVGANLGITTGNATVTGDVQYGSNGPIQTGNLVSGGNVFVQSQQTVTTGNVQAGGDLQLSAAGAVNAGNLSAGQSIRGGSNTSFTALNATAGDRVAIQTMGPLTIGNVSAGLVNRSSATGANYRIGLGSTGNLTTGTLDALGQVLIGSDQALNTGAVTGKDLSILAGTTITTGALSAGTLNTTTGVFTPDGRILLANASMAALGGPFGPGYDPEPVFAATPVRTGGAITVNGAMTAGNIRVASGGAFNAGNITSLFDIELDVGGALNAGALIAGDTVEAQADGAITIASASAGLVNPSAATDAEYNVGLRSLTSITAGPISARASIGLSSPGTIAVGNLSAGLHVLGLSGTGFSSGSIITPANTAGGTPQVYLANFSMEALGGRITQSFNPTPIFQATTVTPIGGNIAVNGPVTTGSIRAAATGTTAVTGPISTSFTTFLNGAAGVSSGAITAGQLVSLLSSAGAVTAGALQAGDSISVNALGSVALGNLSAGLVQPSASPNALYRVAIGSNSGSVSTGTIAARRDVGIQAAQAITTGSIAGRDVLLLPGSSLSTGSIQALNGTQPSGRVYIGNFSMASPTNGNVFAVFGNLPLFNLTPIRTGGPITIAGGVTAGSFVAATAQGISLQAITAGTPTTFGFIDIDAGGLATINGRLAAADRIDIASNDIDITSNGSLDALSLDGEIQLLSNNPNGAFIGDGLTGNGYSLSNAEYSRLKAGEIAVLQTDFANLATDMTIGTLSVTAAQLFTDGEAVFATGDILSETPGGLLRVNGNVTGTGFALGSDGGFDFFTGTFELNAATGSISVTSDGTAIGGEIDIEANRIHVASDAILAKLRADPNYEGHVQELNAPAQVQRPEGVLRAGEIGFFPTETLFIQNTGSAVSPAGFFTTLDGTEIEGPDTPPTGGFEIVINGQFQTNTGVLTGRAAYDAAIAQAMADAMAEGETFAADVKTTSTLNGCGITTGTCAFTGVDPVAAISSEIAIVTQTALASTPPNKTNDDPGDATGDGVLEDAADEAVDDLEEGVEDSEESAEEQEEEDAEEAAAAPIAPPAPLIDTRALNPAVRVVEPVAGAGNPALIGSAVNETTAQGQGDNQ